MYRILIVDDEPMIVEGLCALFEEQDAVQLEVYKACLAAEALGIMNRRRIDILLTDIRMPAVSGIELMQGCGQTGRPAASSSSRRLRNLNTPMRR